MMNAPSASLKRRSRFLTLPGTIAPLGSLALLLLHSVWVDLAIADLSGSALPLAAAVMTLLGVGRDAFEQRRLGTLRAIAKGDAPPTAENLEQAAREVLRAPDTSFASALVLFVVGGLLVAALSAWLLDSPPLVLLRFLLLVAAAAPLPAAMAHVAMWRRARAVLRDIMSCGLSSAHLYERLPTRLELPARLAAFGAAAAATPLLFLGDLGYRAIQTSWVAAASGVQAGPSLLSFLAVGFAAVSMVLWCGAGVGGLLGSALGDIQQATARLARGEYGEPRLIGAEFELWAAAAGITLLQRELSGTTQQLSRAAAAIADSSEALSSGRTAHLESGKEQSSALLATSATTEELARSGRQIALNALQVSELGQETLKAAKGGKASADAFSRAMEGVREGNQIVADSVVRLNKRVQQVSRVVEFIEGIADKSDLLALNAELEGNKAGEVGRGFTLVAAEMRRLAESVMQSTGEIARLIDEIRDATNAAVMATEAGVKATDAGADLAKRVGDELARIVDFANHSADAMHSISLATGQQQAGTDQLAASMAEVLEATRVATAGSEEMGRSHEELISVTRALNLSGGAGVAR